MSIIKKTVCIELTINQRTIIQSIITELNDTRDAGGNLKMSIGQLDNSGRFAYFGILDHEAARDVQKIINANND